MGAALAICAALSLGLAGCVPAPSAQPEPEPASTLPTHSGDEPVPAPSGGTIDQQIPEPSPAPTVEVAIGDTAKVDADVTIKLASVKATQVTAKTPGEITGSAVIVTVVVTNKGDSTASVDSAYLNLVASDGTFGTGTTAGDGKPLQGSLASGASATGSYVFMLPTPHGREVTISVSHAAGAPVAQFEGTVS
jgi:hypothetical protein